MWVDYRGSLSTIYNDGEISIARQIIEVYSEPCCLRVYCTYLINMMMVMTIADTTQIS